MDEINELEESENDHVKNCKAEKQNDRAFLRERFLRCINSLGGEDCVLKTIENTELTGTFKCMDMHVQNIFIENLNTPTGDTKNSLVRSQDIYYVHFPKIVNSS